MTDPGLTPEQEAVRRLLAEARHDEPTPSEVVAHLEETLASLVADRDEASVLAASSSAPVVDLRARRRRMAGVGVLAAAAVVVAGVALGQTLPRTGGSDSASSESAGGGSTAREFSAQSDDGSAPVPSAGQNPSSRLGAPGEMKSVAPSADVPSISSSDAALAQRLVDLRARARASGWTAAYDAAGGCSVPPAGRGRLLLVTVDGSAGVALFRRPDGATQQVSVYACTDPEPVRTLTLPAR